MKKYWLYLLLATLTTAMTFGAPMKALIVDGQNNHDWKTTTPILKHILEETGMFDVTVATSPPHGSDMSTFRPRFAEYAVVISNYNGDPWSTATQDDFVQFVRSGGGFVVVHAADNSFPEWKEYNEMIGLGGWGGRNERSGPYVHWVDGKAVRDSAAGVGGSHGQQHSFLIVARQPEHPILKGLPNEWMHNKDELYDRLRGPASNLNVLATAYSDKAKGGSGKDEPMLMTIDYGQGRVFHTTLGHGPEALQCAGFQVTLQRGAEWAATGKVTQKVPSDFPTKTEVRVRRP